MKKILLIAALLLANTGFAASVKVGYINIDHVLTSSPQFVDASERVAKEFKPKEIVLVELSKKIKNMISEFTKDKESLSKEEFKTRGNSISEFEISFKKQAAELQKQFDERNQYELQQIQDLINKVIKEVAEEQNFDLILYQEVAYVSKEINISKTISEKLRTAFK